jgi:hypothetical protein
LVLNYLQAPLPLLLQSFAQSASGLVVAGMRMLPFVSRTADMLAFTIALQLLIPASLARRDRFRLTITCGGPVTR